jgi:four helix bundle protein
MSIARKEARESLYWLRLARATRIADREECEWEVREAGELRAMIVAAIRTAQSNPRRAGASRPSDSA